MHKDDITYIKHILLCIRKIKKYTRGISKQNFNENDLLQDAVIRNIEIIGEASKMFLQILRKNIQIFLGKKFQVCVIN